LEGNIAVNSFPQQQRIVGCVIFYAVRDVSQENRRLIRKTNPSFVEKETPFPNIKVVLEQIKFGDKSHGSLKPRTTVPARTRSNLLLC
jgi:hypothetical protein